MNSSNNLTNLHDLSRDELDSEYDYYVTEQLQQYESVEDKNTEPGIESILLTGGTINSVLD